MRPLPLTSYGWRLRTVREQTRRLLTVNVVDLASTYQQVIPLRSTKSKDAAKAKAFVEGWLAWAGTPKHMSLIAEE